MQKILSEKLQRTLNELERLTDPFFPANFAGSKPDTNGAIHQNIKKP